MRSLVAALLVLPFAAQAFADEPDPSKLPDSARQIIKRSDNDAARVRQAYLDSLKVVHGRLIADLEKELRAATKKGNRDEAVAVRDYLDKLKKMDFAKLVEEKQPSGATSIVGNWRWFDNNAVTIQPDGTLVVDGKKRGAWTTVDRAKRQFQLTWELEKTYIDDVTLSADGRMLEGRNQFNTPISATRETSDK